MFPCLAAVSQALGIIDRYSTAAAAEVLKATSWLAEAAGAELRPYLARLGETSVSAPGILSVDFFFSVEGKRFVTPEGGVYISTNNC